MTASGRRTASTGAGASAGDTPWAGHPSASGLNAADRAAVAEKLALATGGAAPHHAWRLVGEVAAAAGFDPAQAADGGAAGAHRDSPVLAALEAAMALAPRDPLEGMLVAQMTAVHAAALRCLGRAAASAGDAQLEALYLRLAARLLHLFQRQSETLDRRARRFGPPKAAADAAEAEEADGGAEGRELLARAVAAVRADLDARARGKAARRAETRARRAGPGGGAPPVPDS